MDNNLSNLIVNLGTRSGDPSLWWFLVNHYVEIKESSTKECTWNSGELNQIICNMPDELDVSQAKHSLKEFYLNHSDKLLVTDAELIDLNFLSIRDGVFAAAANLFAMRLNCFDMSPLTLTIT